MLEEFLSLLGVKPIKSELIMAAPFNNNHTFDLRLTNPIFEQKKGRNRQEYNIVPDTIDQLKVDWSKGIQTAKRSMLLCNIPVEYLALFSHANSDAVVTLKGKDILTSQNIEFRPTYFESTKSKEFRLVDLFTVKMTSENRRNTQFRVFSNNWHAMIDSLPWRHNEVISLLCIYNFIETQYYSENEFKVTLADLVKECAKRTDKTKYVSSLYSILVLQDTDMFIVNSEKNIIIPQKKLFEIKSTNDSIRSLETELKNIGNNNAKDLLEILSQFEIEFRTGALGDIEKLHKHETGKLPPNFTPKKGSKKPHYWKERIYKGGHLFHTLHPHLDISPVIIRAWALLNAFQPNLTCGFKDIVKGFDLETFCAICGISYTYKFKPQKLNEYLEEISKYWGGIETKDNNLFIKYGYEKNIHNKMKEEKIVTVFDLQYGRIKTDSTDEEYKCNLIKDVSLEQLKQALLKHKLNEDDATSLAEQIKMKEFAQKKSTGKEIEIIPNNKYTESNKDVNTNQNENKIAEFELKNREPSTYTEHKKIVGGSAFNKNQASNDAVKRVLLIKIDALQNRSIAGVSGCDIRKKLLQALENGISPSVISIELEKIEQRLSQEYRRAI